MRSVLAHCTLGPYEKGLDVTELEMLSVSTATALKLLMGGQSTRPKVPASPVYKSTLLRLQNLVTKP